MVATALAAMLTTACKVASPSLPSSWAQSSNRLRLPGELDNREQLVKEIDRAQRKWMTERPLEYELTVVRGYNNPARCVSLVRGVNILRSHGGYNVAGRDLAPNLRSVEGLFAEAREATLFPAYEVEMVFDERFGYPSQVRIDLFKGGYRDDETTLNASIKVIVP